MGKTTQKLASMFQKASQKNQLDFDSQIINTINSVLKTKNADFRLEKENGLVNSRKLTNKDQ